MSGDESPDYRKRKRTSHACDPCRHRKTTPLIADRLTAELDVTGEHPVQHAPASAANAHMAPKQFRSKSKSDLILDVTLRSESLLHDLAAQVARLSERVDKASPSNGESPVVTTLSPSTLHRPASPTHLISNATLAAFHASTTECILAWPHFKEFHALREDHGFSVFALETNRAPFMPRPSTVHPYASKGEIETIIHSFQRSINYWYPTMSLAVVEDLQRQATAGTYDESTKSCLALLTIALGCASDLVGSFSLDESAEPVELEHRTQRRAMGELHFDCAFKKVYLAQAHCTTEAVQCLFFTALYFAFLQRPLQAWSFINATASKCRLLLSYALQHSPEEQECLRRIFWSCYILESDYLAELSALPQSGIADIESSVLLPGEYRTHALQTDEEQSSLYFMACISMRRLLNRAHDLLYARDTGAAFDRHQFPSVVAELAHQLEEWKDLLPPPFQFAVDLYPAKTTCGAFLRQRYLTCKSVIYRPYLTWVLSSTATGEHFSGIVQEGCKTCLHACWMHAQNLRSFSHTVMIDTWICALSMASVMLITLAASRLTTLRECLSPEVLDMGPHITSLLTEWMHIPGQEVSPSVLQSVKLIGDVSVTLRAVSGPDRRGSAGIIA
ncbi:hypothetical protein FE257_009118 [Aspergillus nanangensis]|uniref:Xylanolytic transcriptional activator regulatory domain-containing protein n=1 Tax=Aspergillus nanangensis TaxID=2582783 RepID=A0AAD4GYV9_ASPNN|nr:hypothetical protein FE257_009118 [Aspergillus nanangensis]